uniref:Retrovirus-related Pol polyprotein from transposon TNT 1-94-like beta-barrel domain-containing protein n=1 Tax=Nicotiana tabacum TaxID=4097 RepID=A0A1S4CTV6_TOBAC
RKKPSGPKSNPSKKRFKGNCYNCGKAGHKSADFRALKKDKKKDQANMVEKHEDIDNLEAFATYAPDGPEEILSIKNSAMAKIEGCGKIFLKITSGNVVTLNNILHVPEIRKNLVSTALSSRTGLSAYLYLIRL